MRQHYCSKDELNLTAMARNQETVKFYRAESQVPDMPLVTDVFPESINFHDTEQEKKGGASNVWGLTSTTSSYSSSSIFAEVFFSSYLVVSHKT